MKKQNYIITAMCISVILSGLLLTSIKVNADDVVDYVAIFVPTACTMSGVVNSGEEHSAKLQNGLYREDIGKTTLNIICNDNEGFSIYAVGDTNDEYGNTVLDGHVVSPSFDIATGTATSGSVSNWSMKLSTDSEALSAVSILNGFSAYSNIPDTYTKVASRDSLTSSGSQNASLDTTYAVYINGTQPADTYSGQVKYTLVHPHNEAPPEPQATAPGYIAYYPNTSVYEGSMGQQPLVPSDTSATLLASNYSRAGFGFAGWNTSYDYSGDFYGPNETITFEAGQFTDGESGLSLYAVWVESEGIIQNWTGCNSLSPTSYNPSTGLLNADLSSVTALTDIRDNQSYAIAKLADGNCWIIENLYLTSESTRDESSRLLSQGYGKSDVYGNFIGLANSENGNFTNTSASNSIYGIVDSSEINIGAFDNPIYRLPRYNDTNTVNRGTNVNNSYANTFGYGNYYNWAAAMASTKYYTSSDNAGESEVENSNFANTSICPAGWRLPYGLSYNDTLHDGEIAALDRAMGGNGRTDSINAVTGLSTSFYWRKFPNNFVFSGNYNGNSVDSKGSAGFYWTTTASESDKARGLRISSTSISPAVDAYRKYYGFSVRCLVQNQILGTPTIRPSPLETI